MILGFSLAIMMILTFISVIMGSDFIAQTLSTTVDNDQIVNGSTSTLEMDVVGSLFSIDPIQGAIVIFIVLIVLATAMSVQIVGSGLNEGGTRLIVHFTAYMGLWGILSVLAWRLIIEIAVFGSLIYIALTLMYLIGVLSRMNGGNL